MAGEMLSKGTCLARSLHLGRARPSFGEGSKWHVLGGIEVIVKFLVAVVRGQLLVVCCCGFVRFGLLLFFVAIVAAAPEHGVGRVGM